MQSISVGEVTVTPKTDVLGRNVGKEISYGGTKIAEENIYYHKVGDHATIMPSSMRFGNKNSEQYSVLDRLQYKYDGNGNITEVRENGELLARYAYDKLDRLVREDNKKLGKTWLYSYDNNGNILYKKELEFTLLENSTIEELDGVTTLYGYDGDKLLSFGDETFEYDLIGNPKAYRGKAAQWANGRQLVGYDGVTFTYDGQGRRISKGAVSFTYDSNDKLLKQSNGLSFIYDNSGIVGLKYDNKTYFYRKDVQGNIIAILDSTGKVMVEYIYDAWGNHAVEVLDSACEELSQLNPFRYRGYYYDTETGLYYLKSRYYDPETGRFITIDDLSYLNSETINGLNLYAYCGNNPVMYVDPSGNFGLIATFFLVLGGIIFSSAVSGVISGITEATSGGNFWDGFWGGAVNGFISTVGLAIGLALGPAGVIISGFLGFAGGIVGGIVTEGLKTNWNISGDFWKTDFLTKVLPSAILNGFTNILSFGLGRIMGAGMGSTFVSRFIDGLKFGGFAFSAGTIISFPMMAIGIAISAIIEYITNNRRRKKENNSD